MRCLIDTHFFLYWLNSDKKLTTKVRKIIEDPKNQIFLSVVSGWEISIKNRNGKLPLKTSLAQCFKKSDFEILDINLNHVLYLDKLPLIHNDPFDRLLVAQAQTEKLVLITDDLKIKKYNVKVA